MFKPFKPNLRKPGEFRLLRCLGIDVNVVRFKKHVRAVQRGMYSDPCYRRVKLKARVRRLGKSRIVKA